MVPKETILEEALKHNVDIVGLSGLITPSLDEMIDVAALFEKNNVKIPILIGGATTSEIHTAVKIEPNYSGVVMHVLDASKSVPVATKLISSEKATFGQAVKDKNEDIRKAYANRSQKAPIISLEEARKNALEIDWNKFQPKKPNEVGIEVTENIPIHVVRPFIDWSPFFNSWELKGTFPKIFDHPQYGDEAKKLFDDANLLLDQLEKDRILGVHAISGVFPCKKEHEHVHLFVKEDYKTKIGQLHLLRQQTQMQTPLKNKCLTDYLHPEGDYIGLFAVTAGIDIETYIEQYQKENDDYKDILIKAVADRLAEATAEWLHQEVRMHQWGYSDEVLSNEDLIAEKYQGIRPAPGYAACPDHSEKQTIWNILNVSENIGISLTENFAMFPTASVSGYYFAHPESKYFGIGRIGQDQIEQLAALKGIDIQTATKYLRPNLD
jgi:5-methyltetrahydrofolate--homocysteine methyltransferase